MPQSHSDHGVTGQRHWLLDEELSSSSNGRVARPAALERVELPDAPFLATATVTLPPRHNFVLLLGGLVSALLVYALLSSAAVVGALDEVFPRGQADPVRITATFEEPGAGQLPELRTLLARTPDRTRERRAATSSATIERSTSPTSPAPDDGVVPPLPLLPASPPLIPEIEIPPVEVPQLLKLEVPEVPEVPELPKLEVPELPHLPQLLELP
jgi:hypothetical protein